MCKKLNILEIFIEDPGQWFHLREIARLLDISPRTAKKYLTELVAEKFLLEKKERGYLLYRGDQESEKFRDYKISHMIQRLKDTGFISFLEEEFLYPTIILFGSAARGKDMKKSDVDIFVLTEKKKEVDVSDFEKKMNRSIQQLVMDKEGFERVKKQSPELVNNILNGIVISGQLEVFR
ncbi:MAG: nucleotidyltransferase domain-containing protein [Methanosarcinales archaeon Met12]|nr:MAG: nucleotidyltransferase domain-containing protein [Methanosarcinales archaeon Met12]